ncbi:unnamed protein product [Chondrus crispus]|uniref:Uncharacterized protein n=1 Tax=Chondrus crispus TaxID=2769 RepID=R7Q3I3_CHOCR|nr:unnamed protein product [Chondrus crispus]CDF32569.1 unnamed protein product [Chondrus crispus]|eukprot:XP_005712234.1 unnamed protein product [Chondrus crispus]
MEGFHIERVEWLAILVNMSDVMHNVDMSKTEAQNTELEEREFEPLPHNDFALENLQEQLGIRENFLGEIVEGRSRQSECVPAARTVLSFGVE